MPSWVKDKCIYCGLCQAVCPAKVIEVKKQEKELTFNEKDCIYCGKCVKVCPTSAWEGRGGFIVYFGGLFGNRIAVGKQLLPIIFSKRICIRLLKQLWHFLRSMESPVKDLAIPWTE